MSSNLPETLSNVALNNLQSLPSEIENWHIVYVPELGYMIAITKWKIFSYPTKEITDLKYKFSANGVDYCKSSLTKGNYC